MKKLLTTLFMAVLAVSAFADITTQTITPTVYHEGTCERAGTLKFVVDNDQDYQQIDSDTFILVRVQLTDNARFCHDLDGVDDGVSNWVDLEVDGVFWTAGEVQGRALAGDTILYIKICDNPWDDANGIPPFPGQAGQGWYIVGNSSPVGDMLVAYDENALCIDYSNTPEFTNNDFHLVSITDWLVQLDDLDDGQNTGLYTCLTSNATTGIFLGTSYDSANPAIAYGGPENPLELTYDSNCDKYSGLSTDDVYLCPVACFIAQEGDVASYYECHDTYRVGELDLNNMGCSVWLEEDTIGMLPENSVLTMTVVDANGDPLSTVADGVYLAESPSLMHMAPELTNMGVNGSELVIAAGTWGSSVDLIGTGAFSVPNDMSQYNDVCGAATTSCADLYNLYASRSWVVTGESESVIGQIEMSDIYLGRYTEDGPVCAYIKIAWAPYPCGAGGDVVLWDYPICFVECPDEPVMPDWYDVAFCYYTYFPAADPMPGWWQGLAVTNTTFFYQNFAPQDMFGEFSYTDQPIDLTLWFLERDGAMYKLEAGTIPASGISTFLVMDETGTMYVDPVLVSGSDSAFGDERYWVVAQGDATVPNTLITIDGFGMLGNGDEAQGFLPRALSYQSTAYYNKK